MTLDFSRSLHFFWALMPEMILCFWGMVVLIAGVSEKYQKAQEEGGDPSFSAGAQLGWLSMIGLALAGAANAWLYGVTEVGTTSMIAIDDFRLFGNWIFLAAAALGIPISFTYVYRQRLQAGEFYALILFATAGMMFMGGSRDLIVIFLGLEVMSIAVYALTAFNRRDRRSAEAGIKYFLLGAFSTGFLLYGIALVYGATGSTNVAAVATALSDGSASTRMAAVGAAFLVVGFGFKVSAVPFHMWTPDVYEGAPAPVTAWMSVAVKAAAFVAFVRVFFVGLDALHDSWFSLLWSLAALTMVLANLMAMAQDNVKRMLAYSSVAHGGYLLVAITATNHTAAAALMFYLLVYTVMNIGAFAIVIGVAHQAEERLNRHDYSGFGWQQPALGILLTIFLLSLAGFPGTGGFMGKMYLLQGAAESELWYLMVILVLTTIASYWYYLRVAWYMWMKDPIMPGQHDLVITPITTRIALTAAVIIVVFLGFFPSGTLEFAATAARDLGVLGGGLFGAP